MKRVKGKALEVRREATLSLKYWPVCHLPCSASTYVHMHWCMGIFMNDINAISGGQNPEKPMKVFAKCSRERCGASEGQRCKVSNIRFRNR